MNIGSSTPLQQLTPLKEYFSINDVRTFVAKQLRVDIEFVTSETHFTNDLGADLLDRVELMLAHESRIHHQRASDLSAFSRNLCDDFEPSGICTSRDRGQIRWGGNHGRRCRTDTSRRRFDPPPEYKARRAITVAAVPLREKWNFLQG
jgi:acyl carrier protein